MTEADRALLAHWLREQRGIRGIKAPALASLLSVSLGHIYYVERMRCLPSLDLLDRWLRLFEIDLLGAIGARS